MFFTNSKNKRVHILVRKANKILHSEEFKKEISKVMEFNPSYTSRGVTGAYIWLRLMEDPSLIEVLEYKSKNPWTKSNGFTKNDGRLEIYLNTRKFFRSDASILGTISHEAVHEADNNDEKHFYHHGDNTPKGGTAPEVVADIFYQIESGIKSTESSAI